MLGFFFSTYVRLFSLVYYFRATSFNCLNNVLLNGWCSVADNEIWIACGSTGISVGSPPLATYFFNKKLLLLIIFVMVGFS